MDLIWCVHLDQFVGELQIWGMRLIGNGFCNVSVLVFYLFSNPSLLYILSLVLPK